MCTIKIYGIKLFNYIKIYIYIYIYIYITACVAQLANASYTQAVYYRTWIRAPSGP